MATHDNSITCVAKEDLFLYAIVKCAVEEPAVDGLPVIECTDTSDDHILGIALQPASAGELVGVRLIYAGLMPANIYGASAAPGAACTIGLNHPGALSVNTDLIYKRAVAYIIQTVGVAEPHRAIVMFNRSYYI